MPRCIAQVTLERDGALPEDAVVNTWHFENDTEVGTDTFARDQDGLRDRLVEFYQGLQAIFSSILTGNGTIKLYDWDDDIPRVPKLEDTFTFTPTTGVVLPAEVAICLSMEGERESGVKMARRRGRVYLGPLSGEVVAVTGTPADAKVHPSYRTQILTHATDLAVGSSSGSFRMAIWSPTETREGGSTDDAWNDVVRFWVDDAFDTQRRRGGAPTARQFATV